MIDRQTFYARISGNGNSVSINVTKEVKIMGLGRGDIVKVTIERIPGGEEAPPEQ